MRAGLVAASMLSSAMGRQPPLLDPQSRRWIPCSKLGASQVAAESVAAARVEKEPSPPTQQEERAPVRRRPRAPDRLRVVTYNILAQCYIRSSQFWWSSPLLLKWKARSQLVMKELGHYASQNVDILCLQEVDRFHDFYRRALDSLGYDQCTYVRRTASRTPKQDGCAIFWRSCDFELLEEQPVLLNALNDEEWLQSYPPKVESDHHLLRDCVGAIAVLKAKARQLDDGSHKGGHTDGDDNNDGDPSTGFIISTCHLFWNPKHSDVKHLQAWWMLDQLAAVRRRYVDWPVILTGDFNSIPTSSVVQMITTGQTVKGHPDVGRIPPDVMDKVAAAPFTLRDTYGPGAEMTNFTPNFANVLDYIFLEGNVHAEALLEMPTRQALEEEKKFEGFPQGDWPSDHIALGAELVLGKDPG